MSTAVASGHTLMPKNSNFTELYGMLVALEQFIRSRAPEELRLLEEVVIINDNQASVSQARSGVGPEPHVEVLKDMQALAAAHHIRLLFEWLPRTAELIVQADHLTRHEDPSDWLLDRTALTDAVCSGPTQV